MSEWDGTLPEDLQPARSSSESLEKMKGFLRGCAGDEAIEALSATDFRLRRLHQAKERMYDKIADALECLVGDAEWDKVKCLHDGHAYDDHAKCVRCGYASGVSK